MKNKKEKFNKGEIVIYQASNKEVDLRVRLENETLWLNARQMALIFGVQRPAIVKHIANIYKTGELEQEATCSILEQVASDGKVRKINLYNLDTIISVGYRVNSQKATAFRIWATSILKNYLVKGYAVNQKRLEENRGKLEEIQETIQFLQDKSQKKNLKGQEGEILNILADYSKTLTLLEDYDKGRLKTSKGRKGEYKLEVEEVLEVIKKLKEELLKKKEAGDLFGNVRSGSFEGIISGLYQTFAKKELYSDLNSKASHLLYLVIKDHPFSDGNKRIASFLFIYFLDKNNYLHRKTGEKKINDNALTALALLIAESDPREKDTMVKLIFNLIS